MTYDDRLFKFLKDYNGVFSISEIASIWKRNRTDVWVSAQFLAASGKIKISKDGVLSLKGKHANSM